jgi:hypothetical protein
VVTTLTDEPLTAQTLARMPRPPSSISRSLPRFPVWRLSGAKPDWARELVELGHEVKLIAPQYVRPFVKRQKNDAADAEAIVIAAQRPEMRFVEPKSEWQQAKAVLFRARERLVYQRTELVNILRAVLYEYGHAIPQGIVRLRRMEALFDEPNSDLPALVYEECRDLLAGLALLYGIQDYLVLGFIFSVTTVRTSPSWFPFPRKSARRQFGSKPRPRRSRKWRPKRI